MILLTFFKQAPLTADVHVSQVLYRRKTNSKMDREKGNSLNIFKLYVMCIDGNIIQYY